jgi:hypothetical protein
MLIKESNRKPSSKLSSRLLAQPGRALPESLLPASIVLNNWVDASMDDDLNLFEQMDANYFFLLMFAS